MDERSCFYENFPLPFFLRRRRKSFLRSRHTACFRLGVAFAKQIGDPSAWAAFTKVSGVANPNQEGRSESRRVLLRLIVALSTWPQEQDVSYRSMKKIQNSFPEYEFVFHHQICVDEYAVILSRKGVYAVCRIRPRHQVAVAPNYLAKGVGVLAAPLTSAGLEDLLQWDSFEVAVSRFRQMTGISESVAMLLPEAKHVIAG